MYSKFMMHGQKTLSPKEW